MSAVGTAQTAADVVGEYSFSAVRGEEDLFDAVSNSLTYIPH